MMSLELKSKKPELPMSVYDAIAAALIEHALASKDADQGAREESA
jgi:hypothetical protein